MAIVFGHEIHIFIPKCSEGGSTSLGNIPKKNYCFPKIFNSWLLAKTIAIYTFFLGKIEKKMQILLM